MKGLRHLVTVLRPTTAHGSRGELAGQPQVVLEKWPCSIETLSGREVEQARTTFAEATHKVSGYMSRLKPFRETDFIQFGERKLHIGFVNDIDQRGLTVELLCGELKDG